MRFRLFYLNWLVFVYAFYCYFNRGVAYSYLVEVTWLLGVFLIIKNLKSYVISWDRKTKILLLLIAICVGFMARGILIYSLFDVIRDSFMINYSVFVFIVFYLRTELPILKQKIANIYKYFPLIVTIGFLLRSFIPFFAELSFFGEIPFLVYKNGDLAVHLLIATFFLMNGTTQLNKRFTILNVILIGYLFLITATFNRSGMLSYIVGITIFLYYSRKTDLAKKYFSYIKFIPIVLLVALPIYMTTKVKDKVQGRDVGVDQLRENISSIVNPAAEKNGLNKNVIWRLVWWGKIIDYTFTGEYFIAGKGLGVNLSEDDDIIMEDDSLRSPHNFHLNILARFGVPIFFLWLYWLSLILSEFKNRRLSSEHLTYLCILLAFLVNASFDVALEGPMSAFPFWLIMGILFVSQTFYSSEENS